MKPKILIALVVLSLGLCGCNTSESYKESESRGKIWKISVFHHDRVITWRCAKRPTVFNNNGTIRFESEGKIVRASGHWIIEEL